jgi:hypothetical protein
VEIWGRARYGDPCRECGYEWSIGTSFGSSTSTSTSTSNDSSASTPTGTSIGRGDAVAAVAAIPDRYASLLDGRDASLKHPDLDWTAGAYVCHVTDNLRIWAERLVGAAMGGGIDVPGYDESLLGRARAYNQVPVAGALWSLRLAAAAWVDAVALAAEARVVLLHTERGEQRTADVVRNNAHDAFHHAWDIRRTLEHAASQPLSGPER